MACDLLNLKDLGRHSRMLCVLYQLLSGVCICQVCVLWIIDLYSVTYWKQACAALEEIHTKQYLHGDVKPENMLIINGQLKLNDFDSCVAKEWCI